ncbi:MAG: hypothetical protein P8Y71_00165 [Pseudolabrys sp.]
MNQKAVFPDSISGANAVPKFCSTLEGKADTLRPSMSRADIYVAILTVLATQLGHNEDIGRLARPTTRNEFLPISMSATAIAGRKHGSASQFEPRQ